MEQFATLLLHCVAFRSVGKELIDSLLTMEGVVESVADCNTFGYVIDSYAGVAKVFEVTTFDVGLLAVSSFPEVFGTEELLLAPHCNLPYKLDFAHCSYKIFAVSHMDVFVGCSYVVVK